MSKIVNEKIKNEFNRIYAVKKSSIDYKEKRLNRLKIQGGNRILDYPDCKTKIDNLKREIAVAAHTKTYKENLDAKEDLLDKQIDLITNDISDWFFGDAAESNAKKFIENQDKAITNFSEFFNSIITSTNEKTFDTTELKKKKLLSAIENGYNKYKNEINTCEVIQIIDDQFQIVVKNDDGTTNDNATAANKDNYSKCLDTAYDKAKNYIDICIKEDEAIRKQHEENVLKACKLAVQAETAELANLDGFSVEKTLEAANKKIAEIPQTIEATFRQIENLLYGLANGFFKELIIPSELGLNAINIQFDALLDQLYAMVDPVFNTVMTLPIPVPPVIAPILDLIKMAKSMGGDPPGIDEMLKQKINEVKAKMKLPEDWKQTLEDMFKTLVNIFAKILFGIFSLVFDLFAAVMSALSAVGAPLPWPLNLVPNIIALVPKLKDLVFNLPEVMYRVLLDKLKAMAAQIVVLGTSAGSAISNVFVPLPACPEAKKKTLLDEIEAKKKEAEAAEKKKAEEEAEKKKAEINKKAELDSEYKNSPLYQQDLKDADAAAKKKEEDKKNTINSLSSYEQYQNKKLIEELYGLASMPAPVNIDTLPVSQPGMIKSGMNSLASGAQNISNTLKSIQWQ